MTPAIAHWLDVWGRRSTPVLTILMLVLIGVVPFSVPGLPLVAPAGPMIAVFYWAVYRPDLLPAVAVFALGLAEDVLAGTPIGVSSLVYLFVYGTSLSQRRALLGKPFVLAWMVLLVIGLGAAAIAWLLNSILLSALVPPRALIFQTLATIVLFPCLAWALVRVHRYLVH
ncbi:MAG: rod shape-determining protein MreD [Proteobacteria bacterium]|nr:rod shape-determining protein MreD [Pseudomonadota bacterium]MBI3496323.1 rod shape-determining protein MreD [Pseudomonadota bacterium]